MRAITDDPAVPPPARITADTPSRCEVALAGDIDLSAQSLLDSVLDQLRAGAPRDVSVDMTAVTFLGSTGLSFIAGLHQWTEPAGATVSLVGPSPIVVRALTLTGFDRVVRVMTSSLGSAATEDPAR